jgi:large subunit ribosomal protein L5
MVNNMARLQQFYREKIVPELMAKFGYTSVMQVPRLRRSRSTWV